MSTPAARGSTPNDFYLLIEAHRVLADPRIHPYRTMVLGYIVAGCTGDMVRHEYRLWEWERDQLASAVDRAIAAGITPEIARKLAIRLHRRTQDATQPKEDSSWERTAGRT